MVELAESALPMLPAREAIANRTGERWRVRNAEDLTPQGPALGLLHRPIGDGGVDFRHEADLAQGREDFAALPRRATLRLPLALAWPDSSRWPETRLIRTPIPSRPALLPRFPAHVCPT